MYDAIVIGVGGVGSAALFHLASRGARVLGLDRFPPGHDRGSSHGRTRIIRQAYFEHPDYVPLLRRAYELWRQLEQRRGRPLLHEVGLLQVGPPDGAVVRGVLDSAARHGLEIERLTPAEIRERWPAFQPDEDTVGVFERRAGYLDVEDCVTAHAEEARRLGAEILIDVTVTAIRCEPQCVVVETNCGLYRARRVVVTAGAWAGQLLPELAIPLTVLRKSVFWYPTHEPRFQAAKGCPTFLFETPEGVFYGFPAIDELGLKAAEHSGGAVVTDPLQVDRSLDDANLRRVQAFLSRNLPGAERERGAHSVCLYTMSPDEHFLVDPHPRDERIVLAVGLSGHGFKFTCVLGQALADLALDGRTNLPIDFLSLRRPSISTISNADTTRGADGTRTVPAT